MIKPENRNCFEFFRDCTKDFGVYDVSESFGNLISRKKFMRDIEAIAGFLDSKNIKTVEEEMKKKYKLTPKDKIEKIGKKVEMISTFIDVLK